MPNMDKVRQIEIDKSGNIYALTEIGKIFFRKGFSNDGANWTKIRGPLDEVPEVEEVKVLRCRHSVSVEIDEGVTVEACSKTGGFMMRKCPYENIRECSKYENV